METARKITVEVPLDLLEKAQRASGTGVTQTVRAGLQLVAASRTYARLRRLRGKVRFTRTLAELKADRPSHPIWLTLVLYRRRVLAEACSRARCSARVRQSRLKEAAGGCGGYGLMASADLTAMGIESFFLCSLLILQGLGKTEKSETRCYRRHVAA
jgi:hypothetical protein